MSRKFSFLVIIENGKPVSQSFVKDDTHLAKEKFNAARADGKEAYLYLLPLEDKRCKSAEQSAASVSKTAEAPKPTVVEAVLETAKSIAKVKKPKDTDESLSI